MIKLLLILFAVLTASEMTLFMLLRRMARIWAGENLSLERRDLPLRNETGNRSASVSGTWSRVRPVRATSPSKSNAGARTSTFNPGKLHPSRDSSVRQRATQIARGSAGREALPPRGTQPRAARSGRAARRLRDLVAMSPGG